MKKIYRKPTVKLIEMDMSQALLNASIEGTDPTNQGSNEPDIIEGMPNT